MRIGIHRHADIAVAHKVLEYFGIHPGTGHVAAVGMAADMRRDGGHLHAVDFIVPVNHVVEAVLPVHRASEVERCHVSRIIFRNSREARDRFEFTHNSKRSHGPRGRSFIAGYIIILFFVTL